MLLSIREIALPPDEAAPFVASYRASAYLGLVLAVVILYDSRASTVGILFPLLLLTS